MHPHSSWFMLINSSATEKKWFCLSPRLTPSRQKTKLHTECHIFIHNTCWFSAYITDGIPLSHSHYWWMPPGPTRLSSDTAYMNRSFADFLYIRFYILSKLLCLVMFLQPHVDLLSSSYLYWPDIHVNISLLCLTRRKIFWKRSHTSTVQHVALRAACHIWVQL